MSAAGRLDRKDDVDLLAMFGGAVADDPLYRDPRTVELRTEILRRMRKVAK